MAHGQKHTQSEHTDMVISSPANGEALVYNSSTSKWENKKSLSRPACRVYAGDAQSILNATYTNVEVDTANYDTHSMIDGYNLEVPAGQGGKYLIIASVGFSNNANGKRIINIYKDGVGALAYLRSEPVEDGDHTVMNLTDIHDLAAGDKIRMQAYQSSGGNLNLLSGSYSTFLCMMRMD